MTINLKDLGITKKELQDRVVNQICNDLMLEIAYDEDGEYNVNSPIAIELRGIIKQGINDKVKAIADKHILPNVNQYIENLTLQATNKWGESTGQSLTFIEYLVQQAEAYLTEKVNYAGKSQSECDSYSFKGTQTRLTHIVHQYLHDEIENAMKQAVKNANDVITQGIQETVKIKLAEISEKLKVAVSTGK